MLFSQNRLKGFCARFTRKRRDSRLESLIFQKSSRVIQEFAWTKKIKLFSILILTFSLIGFVHFSGFFAIKKISLQRSSLDLSLTEIERVAQKLALNKNLLYFQKTELVEALKNLRPDIARIEVTKKFPAELAVSIFKFPVVAEIQTNAAEKIFLNENGVRVFDEFPASDLLILTIEEDLDLTDPKQVLIEPEYLTRIREAFFYFEATLELPVILVKYLPTAREVHLKTENFAVWLTLSLDLRSQIDKFFAALEVLDLEQQSYQYFDLRPQHKIFFQR